LHFDIYILHLLLTIEYGKVNIQLKTGKTGKVVISHEKLTVGQGFDIVLIKALDKLLRKNRMEKLSLKNVKIQGEVRSEAISGMILKTVAEALKN